MRYEKLETLLRVALYMRGNAEGLSLDDIFTLFFLMLLRLQLEDTRSTAPQDT